MHTDSTDMDDTTAADAEEAQTDDKGGIPAEVDRAYDMHMVEKEVHWHDG